MILTADDTYDMRRRDIPYSIIGIGRCVDEEEEEEQFCLFSSLLDRTVQLIKLDLCYFFSLYSNQFISFYRILTYTQNSKTMKKSIILSSSRMTNFPSVCMFLFVLISLSLSSLIHSFISIRACRSLF